MLELVKSGGQTGADIAGLKAAKVLEIPTGGYMPKGFRTLDGDKPEYARLYHVYETSSRYYGMRTRKNVETSDATFQFADKWDSPGERLTSRYLDDFNKPLVRFRVSDIEYALEKDHFPFLKHMVMEANNFLVSNDIKVLNIAGNSEKTRPGIENIVFKFLLLVFTINTDGGNIGR